jgi:cytochrome c peroxidase
MRILKFIGCIIIAMLLTCCDGEPEPEMRIDAPVNFPSITYNTQKNPVTTKGFELGRSLFYDGILSRDGTISCGSCHQQGAAFSHRGHIVSHGIDDKLGTRNAPPIMNLAWQKYFLWDGGVHDLDLQPVAPIQNPVEMDEKLERVLDKLRNHESYPDKFDQAFGSNEINTERLLKALSQFMVTLVSGNSRYDKYKRGEGEVLTSDEIEGLNLVQQKCASCHSTDLFTDLSFRDNGLDETTKTDYGRYAITLKETDRFKFKVPSLRNAEVTAPYMHDGRFRNLDMVLDHYAEGVHNNANLDPLLKQGDVLGISLTKDDKARIIAFIKTLTDQQFLRDVRFSEASK